LSKLVLSAVTITSSNLVTDLASPRGRIVEAFGGATRFISCGVKEGEVRVSAEHLWGLSLLANGGHANRVSFVMGTCLLGQISPVGGTLLGVVRVVESGIVAPILDPDAGPVVVGVPTWGFRLAVVVFVPVESNAFSTVARFVPWMTVPSFSHVFMAELSFVMSLGTWGSPKARRFHVLVLCILREGLPVEAAFSSRWIVKLHSCTGTFDPDPGPIKVWVALWSYGFAVKIGIGQVTVAAAAVARVSPWVAFSIMLYIVWAKFSLMWACIWCTKTVFTVGCLGSVIQGMPVECAFHCCWIVEFLIPAIVSHPFTHPGVSRVIGGALWDTLVVPEFGVHVALSA